MQQMTAMSKLNMLTEAEVTR